MLKKIFLITLLLITLSGAFVYGQPIVLAQATGTPSTELQSPEFMFDLGTTITHKDIKTQSWIRQGINYLFDRAITIMAAIVGSVAVLMMVVGGFMMMFAGAKEESYKKGQGMIIRAGIGLVVVLGAYILVTTVQLLITSIFK